MVVASFLAISAFSMKARDPKPRILLNTHGEEDGRVGALVEKMAVIKAVLNCRRRQPGSCADCGNTLRLPVSGHCWSYGINGELTMHQKRNFFQSLTGIRAVVCKSTGD